jgi:hypothetical protein
MPATSTMNATTTAAEIGTSRHRRVQLTVQPPASGTVYIGGPDVTTSTGRPLAAGDDPFVVYKLFEMDMTPSLAYWVVAGSTIAIDYEEIVQ